MPLPVVMGCEASSSSQPHLDSVRACIANLKVMEAVLQDMAERCAGSAVTDCPIIEALFQEPKPAS